MSPEIDYDDSLLQTSESLAAVDWDSIEGAGKLSPGQHLCLVKKVSGYIHNFQTYSGPRAKVMFTVIKGKDKGKTQYDDVTLPHPQEADGSRNRRLLIASRMGLITKGSKDTAQVNWQTLEGRQVLITVEDNVSTKTGKTYSNVTFDGWADPATAQAAETKGAEPGVASGGAYADI